MKNLPTAALIAAAVAAPSAALAQIPSGWTPVGQKTVVSGYILANFRAVRRNSDGSMPTVPMMVQHKTYGTIAWTMTADCNANLYRNNTSNPNLVGANTWQTPEAGSGVATTFDRLCAGAAAASPSPESCYVDALRAHIARTKLDISLSSGYRGDGSVQDMVERDKRKMGLAEHDLQTQLNAIKSGCSNVPHQRPLPAPLTEMDLPGPVILPPTPRF